MWPFKRKPKTFQPTPGKKIPAGDWQEAKPTVTQADRIKEYEAKGYENKGEITFSDGRKAVIMATPGEYVKRKDEGGK